MAQKVRNLSATHGDMGLIPGLGRSPGEGNGNPLQSSCLENSMVKEPGRLQPMGWQRVRHGLSPVAHTYTVFSSVLGFSWPCDSVLLNRISKIDNFCVLIYIPVIIVSGY